MAVANIYSRRPTLLAYLDGRTKLPKVYLWDIPIKPYIFRDCSLENICLSLISSLCSESSSVDRNGTLRLFLEQAGITDVPVEDSAIYEYVENFNPFFPIFQVDRRLMEEVQSFVRRTEQRFSTKPYSRLPRTTEDLKTLMEGGDSFDEEDSYHLDRLYRFLYFSSDLLNCQLTLHFQYGALDYFGDVVNCLSYRKCVFEGKHAKMGKVNLSIRKTEAGANEYISYCIPKNDGSELRKTALLKIMEIAGIRDREYVKKLFNVPQIEKNFFWSLLSSKDIDISRKLLLQPYYIIRAMFKAAFNTDAIEPYRVYGREHHTERPLNAFYLAALNDFDIIFAMYSRFLNTWKELGLGSEDIISEHMQGIMKGFSDELKGFQMKVTSLEIRKAEGNLRELIQYHFFRSDICKRMSEVNEWISRNSEGETEPERKRRKLNEILISYQKHFYKNDITETRENEETSCQFRHYKMFRNYSKIIDFHVALLFFDNSVSIKTYSENLEKIVNMIKFNFLKFIFLHNYCSDECENDDYSMRTAYVQRVQFFDKLTESISMLNDAFDDVVLPVQLKYSVDKNWNLETTSESEPLKFSIDQVIIDEFLLHRLRRYLYLSLAEDLEKDLERMKFVITRTLQVVGEAMSIHSSAEPTLIQAFLVSSLPPPVVEDLRKISLNLCHAKRYERIHLHPDRENKKYFAGLVADVRKMNTHFHHIYDFQIKIVEKYYIVNAVQSLEQELEKLSCEVGRKNKTFKFIGKCLSEYRKKMTKVAKDIEKKVKRHRKKIGRHLDHLNQEAFSLVRNLENASRNYREKTLKNIRYIFSCIKVILEFVKESGAFETATCCLVSIDQVISDIICDEGNNETIRAMVENSCEKVKDLAASWVGTASATGNNAANVDTNEFESFRQFRVRLVANEIGGGTKEKALSSLPEKYLNHIKAKIELIRIARGRKYSEITAKDDNEQRISVKEKLDKLVFNRNMFEKFSSSFNENDFENLISIEHNCEKFYDFLKNPEGKLTKDVFQFVRNNCNYDEELLLDLKKFTPWSFRAKDDASLDNFYNRVKAMKKYVIDGIPENAEFWELDQSESTKNFLRDAIANMLASDNTLQAVMETLMLDCIKIMKNGEDWMQIRRKTNFIFNGMNLRNVLACGNTTLEVVGRILDPGDLARDIASRCLELMRDFDALENLVKMRAENREKFLYAEDVAMNQKDLPDGVFQKINKYLSLLPVKKIKEKKSVREELISKLFVKLCMMLNV